MLPHSDEYERVRELLAQAGIPWKQVALKPPPCGVKPTEDCAKSLIREETQSNDRPSPDTAVSVPNSWKIVLTERFDIDLGTRNFLERRVLLLPAILWNVRVVTILSSRLGRSLESKSAWFRALRAVCASSANREHALVAVTGTAPARYVRRAAELFGNTLVELHVARDADSLGEWWKTISLTLNGTSRDADQPVAKCVQDGGVEGDGDVSENGVPLRAFLSPPITGNADACDWPLPDRAAVSVADSIVALHVRGHGNIHQILTCLLDHPRLRGRVRLALGDSLVKPRLREELMSRGAVGWALFDSGPSSTAPSSTEQRDVVPTTGHTIAARAGPRLSCQSAWEFLTHCTRRTDGPWPGQSSTSYLDDLILSRPESDHSPMATLMRIVTSGKLLASAVGIRGGYPVVCLTAVPLPELRDLRVFRPHRGRWDFQPFGICVRRTALQAIGSRPVAYATAADWENLHEDERPFFQREHSTTRTDRTLDWTVEQEWRIVGDVDLRALDPSDVFAFVPSEAFADQLSRSCPFRVVVID